ncbi:ATP-dependent sacrificial sulfur transferase LarE [Candidatus Bipolaricaulota bacterium]|nr:ATP-dependent sacrificial sulfur transferase LarE [Candidatus Bipolaricaulota bacterium]
MTPLTELLEDQRVSSLRDILTGYDSLIVGFSGGVDSSFLLKAAVDFLGRENVLAVTASGEIFPEREVKAARKIARELDARWHLIQRDYLDEGEFRSNPTNRCYHCKRGLFEILKELAEKRGYEEVADGSISDDISGHRPGRAAGKELCVKRPLEEAELRKEDIRELSRRTGLPTWDKPSNACLATRIPFGEKITKKKLSQVAEAESVLLDLGFSGFRVRHHGDLARIELNPEEIASAVKKRTSIVERLKPQDFSYVTLDLEGYRSGSLTETTDVDNSS